MTIAIIIGVIAFLLSYFIPEDNPQSRNLKPILRIGAVVVLLIGVLMASFRVIEPGRVGVQVLFGSVQERILASGLNMVNPLVDVEDFNVKTQNYTMSAIRQEGERQGDDAIRVLTADGLEVIIDLTILYSVRPAAAPQILSTIGRDYRDIIVRPVSRTEIRNNAVYFDAVNLYSKQRDQFQDLIFSSIDSVFQRRGLQLEKILIRNITLPEKVKQAIEEKITAEQAAQKMKFVLQKEEQEADRKRIEAAGIADYQQKINETLTQKLLEYEMIKSQREIAVSPNTKVIIMPRDGAPVIVDSK